LLIERDKEKLNQEEMKIRWKKLKKKKFNDGRKRVMKR
jgi:hypothetical protein